MLPNRALSNLDIERAAKNLPHFRGVFMRNSLPQKPRSYECGIVNLDKSSGPGSHWVAYYKMGDNIEYFDSFGNLRPPKEVEKYLGNNISYNHHAYQSYNSVNCGHLCLEFLFNQYYKLK